MGLPKVKALLPNPVPKAGGGWEENGGGVGFGVAEDGCPGAGGGVNPKPPPVGWTRRKAWHVCCFNRQTKGFKAAAF